MQNNTIFSAKQQQDLAKKRIGVIGDGFEADIAIANLCGLGIETIYSFDTKHKNRLFNESFLEERFPHLLYIEETKQHSYENFELDEILSFSDKDSLTKALEGIIQVDEIRKTCFTFVENEKKIDSTNQVNYLDSTSNLQGKHILVIGAGGIGNYFCYAAANQGAKITVYDNDVFEETNLNRQIFCEIGINKAEVLSKYLPNITAKKDLFVGQEKNSFDYIVGCVDSAKSRNIIREFARESETPYFDGGVDTSTGRIDLNPKPFSEITREYSEESNSCRFVKNPSIVVPNAIVGIHLARCLGNYSQYSFSFDTLYKKRFSEVKI